MPLSYSKLGSCPSRNTARIRVVRRLDDWAFRVRCPRELEQSTMRFHHRVLPFAALATCIALAVSAMPASAEQPTLPQPVAAQEGGTWLASQFSEQGYIPSSSIGLHGRSLISDEHSFWSHRDVEFIGSRSAAWMFSALARSFVLISVMFADMQIAR